MFYGCTNLNYIKCLATDISASSCTYNLVNGVSSTGIFITSNNPPAWTTGTSGIPSGWNAYTEAEYEVVRHYELQAGFLPYTNNNKTGLVNSLTLNDTYGFDNNIGNCAVIEGISPTINAIIKASGWGAHAEGHGTIAEGDAAHAEGHSTHAIGSHSHAEGSGTYANGLISHAEGHQTRAEAEYTHTEGYFTQINTMAGHAEGYINLSTSATSAFGSSGNTLHAVGNGLYTSLFDQTRHNAFEVRQNGDIYYADTEKIDGSTVHYYDAPMRKLQDAMVTSTTNALKIEVVQAMPATPDQNTIYIIQ